MEILTKYSLIKLIGILVFCTISGNSQNMRKYWYYKSRLNNDFLKVGTAAGESLPFMQRGVTASGFSAYNANMHSGDATTALGYYIAVLATEYKLLSLNGQNTDRIIHELFCALNAINRLDYKAEIALGAGTGYLNGFFIRDDIPGDFIKNNYDHFNYYNTWGGVNMASWNPSLPDTWLSDKGFHSRMYYGMWDLESSWKGVVEQNLSGHTSFESQDQVYPLLLGLAFVNKYVGPQVKDGTNYFGYGSNQQYLTIEARDITRRIIDNIRDPKDFNGASCNGNNGTGWHIKTPHNCNNLQNNNGGNATSFAYPLAETECLITNGYSSNPGGQVSLGILGGAVGPQLCNGGNYHNYYSKSLGFTTWYALARFPVWNGTPHYAVDTRNFIVNLSAVCNCVYGTIGDQIVTTVVQWLQESPVLGWLGAVIAFVYNLVTSIVHTLVPGYFKNETATSIDLNSYLPSCPFDHAPLARKVLHGGIYQQNTDYSFQYLLNSAPCDGIYNFGTGDMSNFEWSSDSRLDHPDRRGQNAGGPTWASPKGEYNGIDYMLYYNLWELYNIQNGQSATMQNLSDVIVNPASGNMCYNINAFETITASNGNITCNTPTYWRAGKTIYFGSGTSITGSGSSTSGPNFHAYIQKFDCASDQGAYRLSQTDSTSKEDETYNNLVDGYEQSIKYHEQIYSEDNQQAQEANNENLQEENLITELPLDEDPIEKAMKLAYADYSKELFVKPTVTIDQVKAYFTMEGDETAFIHVCDLNGKCIYIYENIKASDTGLTIDFANYATGTYLLKFTTTKGTTKTQKIIKQ